jgi:hypothetical protein
MNTWRVQIRLDLLLKICIIYWSTISTPLEVLLAPFLFETQDVEDGHSHQISIIIMGATFITVDLSFNT